MLVDPQGNPIESTTTEHTPPTAEVEVKPEPVVEPVVEPTTQPEPVSTPTVEAPVEQQVDLGYPTEVAPEFVDLLKRFESKGVKFDDVNLVLTDALESGDINQLNDDVLNSLVGDDAAIIKLALDGVITNAKNNSNANMQALYNIAGSKEAFDSAQAFLNEASEADRVMIEAGLQSDNEALRQLAVEKMMANFKQSPNYEQRGTTYGGNNTPEGTGEQHTTVEEINAREAYELLKAERKAGRWDGTDAGATRKVKEIRANALAYVRNHHGPSAI